MLQQGQPGQEKLNQRKIWLKLLLNSVSCSIVQILWIILWLVNFSKDWPQLVLGVASTSLTVSTFKCCLSLLNNCLYCLVKKQKVQLLAILKVVILECCQHFVFLLQWIQVMLVELNFLIIWKLFLDLWQWWSQIML